jgi:deazaflavin-dependent oxidoreductase (nitroreductase family)
MTVTTSHTGTASAAAGAAAASARAARFGGLFRRLARITSPLTLPLAGKRWNPVFAVVEHRGRRTGRRYTAPVAARRVPGGFVISLAFGAHADWHRNLLAAGGGAIRWRGRMYPVASPVPLDAAVARAAFHPVQRVLVRLASIDGFVRVADRDPVAG